MNIEIPEKLIEVARRAYTSRPRPSHREDIEAVVQAVLAWDAEHGPTEKDCHTAVLQCSPEERGFASGWKSCRRWHEGRYVAKEEPLKEIPLTEEQVKEKIADWIACKYGPSLPTVAGLLKELGLKAKELQ